ncbi:MAG TPA: PqqD family protein [Polyangia bacterium]
METLDGEVLVYDVATDRAHCLDPLAAAVWRACNGKRTVAEIGRSAEVDEATAWAALRKLDRARLLRERLPKAKPTRRQALAAAIAVPLVLSISTPAAAQAASCIGRFRRCTPGGTRCCAGLTCRQGRFGNGQFRCR